MLQNENCSPLFVKDGQLNVFKRKDIRSDMWLLPVIPDKVEIELNEGKYLTELEKLVAFRTSYQYISMKQKLFFTFEDPEDAIAMIFGEFLFFSKKNRQIFPTYRFYELLERMTQGQKDRIFEKIVATSPHEQDIFQLRLMFEHEKHGMDADKDEPAGLDQTVFDRDFLAPEPSKQSSQLKKIGSFDQTKQANSSAAATAQKLANNDAAIRASGKKP